VRRAIIGGVVWLAAAIAAGCSGGGDDGRDVVRPTTVPTQAELIDGETTFGNADPRATAPPDERLFFDMACVDGLVSLTTTRETVFAELPCDRFVDATVIARFQGTRVRVTVCVPQSDCARARQNEDEGKLLIESPTGGSIEFTTGNIWIEER
jgi:hypothetical protein